MATLEFGFVGDLNDDDDGNPGGGLCEVKVGQPAALFPVKSKRQ